MAARDTIVEEVRNAREQYARKFNFDLDAMAADLRRKEQIGGGPPVVSLPKRPVKPIATRRGGNSGS